MVYVWECFNDLKFLVKFVYVYVWCIISVILLVVNCYLRLYVDLVLVCELCFKFICYYMYILVFIVYERLIG